jgi:hypothetical protein
MAPPLWSVIAPKIRPALPCENAGKHNDKIAISRMALLIAEKKLIVNRELKRQKFITPP